MGIKGLFQLLKTDAPDSLNETDKKSYTGNLIAVDASILLYQFLVQIRAKDDFGPSRQLTDQHGQVTSHLQGFFNRTANLLENGIRPVFVFDGKPPKLKFSELEKRKEAKAKAQQELEEAESKAANNTGNIEDLQEAIEDIEKASKRNIHVTKQQVEEVKHLIKLMGLPVVQAPSEAEAQCAELVRDGRCFATCTEDMDSLAFGTSIVLRKLTMPKGHKENVVEINFHKILEGLALTYDEFIDFCILCGCDYCDTIKGIGPKNALKLIKKHGNIEHIVDNLPEKYEIPDDLLCNLNIVRNLFKEPMVIPAASVELIFRQPDREAIIDFLVTQKGFNTDRVTKVINTLCKVNKDQLSVDKYFVKKALPTTASVKAPVKAVNKSVTTIEDRKPTIVQSNIETFFKKKD